jgi:hypothetical protein
LPHYKENTKKYLTTILDGRKKELGKPSRDNKGIYNRRVMHPRSIFPSARSSGIFRSFIFGGAGGTSFKVNYSDGYHARAVENGQKLFNTASKAGGEIIHVSGPPFPIFF